MLQINHTLIEIIQGDIILQELDAIVNSANNKLVMGGGLALKIRNKAGFKVQEEANKLAPIKIGEAVITSGGKLKAKYIIHAATMGMDFITNENIIRESTKNSFKVVKENNITSIAFPALGCGVGKFSKEQTAKILIEEAIFFCQNSDFLKKIVYVLYDEKSYKIFQNVIVEHLKTIQNKIFKYPLPTVDAIIKKDDKIILIERKNPPFGWALPGGFVEYGESLEQAIIREVKEETNLEIETLEQFHTYSAPNRDPRFHTITTVFIVSCKGKIKAQSDAQKVNEFNFNELPENMAFDHKKVINDWMKSGTISKS
ncbi:MAG: macro domain-containing protein [bacterium]